MGCSQFFEEARHCEQWMARHTELLQNRFARDNIPMEQAELLIRELQVRILECQALLLLFSACIYITWLYIMSLSG